MNTTISSFAVVSLFIMSFTVVGSDTNRDDIAARLKPEGQVNIAGAVAAISKVSRSGADIYQTSCAMCHTSGALNAPKSGDAEAWNSRIAQGFDVMLDHAIKGFNGMPPRGTCGDCSDDEIKVAIEHMIEGI